MTSNEVVDHFAPIAKRAPLVVVGISINRGVNISSFGEGSATKPEDALFEIGSITKTFTGLLLADMVQRNEVAFSDPVSKYLSIENPMLSRVSLLDLATHTARLPRIPRDLRWRALRNSQDPYQGYNAARLEAAMTQVNQRSGAGRKFRYSNFGFAILGIVLSNAAGISYEELISRRICDALGLSATSSASRGALEEGYLQGHKKKDHPVVAWDLSSFAPAGVLNSSATDLLAYLRAHVEPSGSPLKAALEEVQRPRVDVRKGRLSIGLAWFVSRRRRITWHGGGTGGFSSFAGFNHDAKVSVVALANARVAGALTRAGIRALEQLSQAGEA